MGTISDKLQKILSTKESIKQALLNKGVSITDSDTFYSYASKINEIQSTISDVNINNIENLSDSWKFYLVSKIGNNNEPDNTYANKTFDDSSWNNVSVPHDWSIYNNFDRSAKCGAGGGFLDGGLGWYRKKLTNLTDNTKRAIIYFDGIYKDAYVYVNGTLVGKNKWYNPFYFDITSNLNFDGNDVLAVYVRNFQPSSRWYSGSGIIRNVFLLTGNKVMLGVNDIYITSPNLETDLSSGIVNTNIKININNTSSTEQSALFKYSIYFNGKLITTVSDTNTLSTGESFLNKVIEVPNPILWDEYKGNLYELVLEVSVSNNLVYKKVQKYGYRYFKFDKDKWFYLNGRRLKIRGVCLHHDLG